MFRSRTAEPHCRYAYACPIFQVAADRHFCPWDQAVCDRRCGLPGLLALYEKISPDDSVELKIAVGTLKLHEMKSRLKEGS